jgi:hypothetical protein
MLFGWNSCMKGVSSSLDILLWFHAISHPIMYLFAHNLNSCNVLVRWGKSFSFYPLFMGFLWDWGPLLWWPSMELCPGRLGREMQGARLPLTWYRAWVVSGVLSQPLQPIIDVGCKQQGKGRSPLAAELQDYGALPSIALKWVTAYYCRASMT